MKRISTLEHLSQLFEIDDDEREHSEELKKYEKGKDRQSELEQLRAVAPAEEAANRLKKLEAEEEEVVEWIRKITAGRRNAQPSKYKRSSTQDDESDDEKDWRRHEEFEVAMDRLVRKEEKLRFKHARGFRNTRDL